MKENISFEKCKVRAKRIRKTSFSQEMYYPKLDLFDFNYENKYKQFICETFFLDKEITNHPLATLIIGFGEENIAKIAEEVKAIINELNRNCIFIEVNGKTFIECVRQYTGKYCTTNHGAFSIIEDIMLNTDNVVVFSEFSKCKKKGAKASLMRSIIKIGDHEKNTTSDLIFIDYAAFYQKAREVLGPYIRCIG